LWVKPLWFSTLHLHAYASIMYALRSNIIMQFLSSLRNTCTHMHTHAHTHTHINTYIYMWTTQEQLRYNICIQYTYWMYCKCILLLFLNVHTIIYPPKCVYYTHAQSVSSQPLVSIHCQSLKWHITSLRGGMVDYKEL